MARSLGGRLRDGVLTVGSVGSIISGVAVINPDSRQSLFDALHGQLPSALSELPVQHFARTVADAVPIGGSAMMALVAAACLLFVLMLRT